jgi:hypothetical protein
MEYVHSQYGNLRFVTSAVITIDNLCIFQVLYPYEIRGKL